MGCTQSKIGNKEAVNRCRERKEHMRRAIAAHNAFASALSDYAAALKNTGAALKNTGAALSGAGASAAAAQLPIETSATPEMIEIPKAEGMPVGPTIEEEEEEEEEENELENDESNNLRQRSSRGARDIRSGGGGGSSGSGSRKEGVAGNEAPTQRATSPQCTQPEIQERFFPLEENVPAPTLGEVAAEEVRVDKRQVESKAFSERPKRAEDDGEVAAPAVSEKALVLPVSAAAEVAPAAKSAKKGEAGMMPDGKRVVEGNMSLVDIFTDLDDRFLKASESAHEVLKMLEATKLHHHLNFSDNRGHSNLSERVMRFATCNRSFRKRNADDFESDENETHATVFDESQALKPSDQAKDPESDPDVSKTSEATWLHYHSNFADNRGEHETHATVLAILQAREKKLYEEVKAGELLKYKYQKKAVALKKQKDRGNHSKSLEKTEAAADELHFYCEDNKKSVRPIVLEIKHLRDEQLYPKLIQLVVGMAKMWETMSICHESQHKTVKNLKSLEIDQATGETSDHHDRTLQLLKDVVNWHEQFKNVVDNQKKYIEALKNWLKLNVIPIESSFGERVSSPPPSDDPLIQKLVHAWEKKLEELPDEPRRSVINKFREDLDDIVQDQEEIIFKEKRGEVTQPRTSPDDRHIRSKKKVEVARTKRLEGEEGALSGQRHKVSKNTLLSFNNRLPELFGALSNFASASSEMYRNLRSLS